ncbi:zf-HC2 domain-containing protein [Streptomyces formicae]|uniref:Zf-HC2 domain-containing protein n=1 Tax=Streptomyces formicae TaxID=1616117 RepID=A0ABY3WJC2_9ACTN|nr:zf-HC2 domain-containing protein [Streptomyces formicae]UNM12689.1 zf-HC2 domain-containing protein [Streptomyces formicae]
MDLRERHRDVAAYALGVLEPADAFRFEEHLSECVPCALWLTDLAPVASALSGLDPVTRPSAGLLDRLLHEVAERRRSGSRSRLRLVAAAAALIVAVPAVAVGLADGGSGGRISATDAATGVYGAVGLRATEWGTALTLRMARVRGPRICELVAVATDGSERPVITWSVPDSPGSEDPLDLEAATALRPDQVDRFEVRTTSGERLVSLAVT